jgi:hypothetical protein
MASRPTGRLSPAAIADKNQTGITKSRFCLSGADHRSNCLTFRPVFRRMVLFNGHLTERLWLAVVRAQQRFGRSRWTAARQKNWLTFNPIWCGGLPSRRTAADLQLPAVPKSMMSCCSAISDEFFHLAMQTLCRIPVNYRRRSGDSYLFHFGKPRFFKRFSRAVHCDHSPFQLLRHGKPANKRWQLILRG